MVMSDNLIINTDSFVIDFKKRYKDSTSLFKGLPFQKKLLLFLNSTTFEGQNFLPEVGEERQTLSSHLKKRERKKS